MGINQDIDYKRAGIEKLGTDRDYYQEKVTSLQNEIVNEQAGLVSLVQKQAEEEAQKQDAQARLGY